MLAQRGAAHFAKRSYAGTKVTHPPGRDPARPLQEETFTHARPPRINCLFSMSTRTTIASATRFITIADPP